MIDGINAVRNATLEGVLPGGGAAFVHASKLLDFCETENLDEKMGLKILKEALLEPFLNILENSGVSGKFHLEGLMKTNNWKIGFEAKEKKIVDLVEIGVFDTFNSVSFALMDACSVGSYLLTIECMVSNVDMYTPTALSEYPKEPF